MTYAEYLKSQGASEEEVKILDTSIARRAFDNLQQQAATAQAQADKLLKDGQAYEDRVNNWFETEKEKRAKLDNELVATQAREAAVRAALKSAHDRGMLDVSKDLGFNLDAPTPPAAPAPGSFDPAKYFTKDDVLNIARQEGQAIAAASSIAYEHSRLFPDRPLDFESLYARAVERKIPVKQLWMDEFQVQNARDAVARKSQEDRDAKIRQEGYEKARTEFASTMGNPETRPLVPSSSPFTFRKETGRDKQPWETGLAGPDGSNDRVQRALDKHFKRETARPN